MALAALDKATALRNYAIATGYRLDTFLVVLTTVEAYETLAALERGDFGRMMNHHVLVADCQAARAAGDPWPVLEHFTLAGLKLTPQKALH
jgi:hypothetical protein